MREARISIVNTHRGALQEDNTVVLRRTVDRIHQVSRDQPDLILIPEEFANCTTECTPKAVQESAQSTDGPIAEELAALARRYRTYIAFGLLRRAGRRVFNSLVLLDRQGKPVWTFDKITPIVPEMTDGRISPGRRLKPFDCDFGRVAGAICFDINFAELGESYFHQEVELLLFSSAFPGGRLLDAWVARYGFALAQSTWYERNRILSCTGAMVAQTSDILPTATACLNLNRRIVHMDGNLEKIDRMRDQYRGDVLLEDLREEAVCVITSLKKGLEVSHLIKEFKVETLTAYFDRSRRVRRNQGGLR
ncbi:MAG: carbon-nitrogen hydrolase family protein [Verrucomicrobiae bacterium]|nr:carbon-nitrogen hydrolase family protein [Verrucomicrobiae bacterium]